LTGASQAFDDARWMEGPTADSAVDERGTKLRRVFVVVWVVLGILGALDHTIALMAFGRRFDLVLPHLEYGHIMFNKNSRRTTVYEYAGDDGARRPLAELVHVPAIGYADSRLVVSVILQPDYLREVCFRATRGTSRRYTFFLDFFDEDVDLARPVHTTVLHCDAHGLTDK
jgi:hypothetical protein